MNQAVFKLSPYFFVHPILLEQMPENAAVFDRGRLYTAALLMKEGFPGYLVSYLSSMIFRAVSSAGFVMDKQRGARQASVSDPLSGEETSPPGSFLFQSLVYLFFASGAFLGFLTLLFHTCVIWPVDHWLFQPDSPQLPVFTAGAVSWLMTRMMLLTSALLIAALLVDFALGLINRFASQLNVYILAMPIKSGLSHADHADLLPAIHRQRPGNVRKHDDRHSLPAKHVFFVVR